MFAVWKYAIEDTTTQIVNLPRGATILAAGKNYGTLYLWVQVETTEGVPIEPHDILVTGTGRELPSGTPQHIDTFIDAGIVYHVFERHSYV